MRRNRDHFRVNMFDSEPRGIWRVHSFIFSKVGFASIAAIFVLIGVVGCATYKSSEKTVTFTVEDKERVTDCDGNGSCDSYYLIWTTEGVFKNDDSVAFGKFRSSDLQGRLKIGQTFHCKVAGWRVGLFSMYPNIISCEKAGSTS